jgi:CRP/FNR family transcriptional regulator, cyclic AMP receptor protein
VFWRGEGELTLSTLQEHAFVRGLKANQLESLAAQTTPVRFEENEIVLVEGERSAAFYLLMSGSAAIELRTPTYAVCVQELGPGSVFGWSALLDEQDTLFQVRARERVTALRIEGQKLKALCRTDPELGSEILRRTLAVVAGRVKATELRFAEMCGVKI